MRNEKAPINKEASLLNAWTALTVFMLFPLSRSALIRTRRYQSERLSSVGAKDYEPMKDHLPLPTWEGKETCPSCNVTTVLSLASDTLMIPRRILIDDGPLRQEMDTFLAKECDRHYSRRHYYYKDDQTTTVEMACMLHSIHGSRSCSKDAAWTTRKQNGWSISG